MTLQRQFHKCGAGLIIVLLLCFSPAWAASPLIPNILSGTSTPPGGTLGSQATSAIASAHPLATRAGLEILDAGGNAFDAAIAVTAALAVVEPTGSGLGGGGFWLLHRNHDDFDVMIDGRERAPLSATKDMYLDHEGELVPRLSVDGPLAAGIPGTPAALMHLAQAYGKLPLTRSLAPAIRLAKEGFAVDEHYRRMARFRLNALRDSPAAAAIFLHDNNAPQAGYIIKQPDLAQTLGAIAQQGAGGFYHGPLAKRLVDGVRAAGGIWTLEDLAQYRVIERAPIVGTYRGMKITSAAPPSSGGIALLTMLNILANYELDKLAAPTRKHLIVEAMRRAYRDRAEYLGDPDFVDIPTARLIHPYYGTWLSQSIRLDRATPSSTLPSFATAAMGNDTTHFSILDNEGNRVAATLSINFPFGAAFVPPGTGVLLNDEMDDFSAKPGTPNVYGLVGDVSNAIEPGKRPLSSMSPTFVEDTRGVAILGTPGGSRIITMVLLGILDFANGNGPESWVKTKRYHHQYLPDAITYEPGAFSAEEITALEALGHHLKARSRPYGNMQAVFWDRENNKVTAASDPRGNGQASVQ